MKYAIRAQETLYYYYEVEADSLEEATQKASEFVVNDSDIVDSDYFDITDIIPLNMEEATK
jgi:hypothetical protein